MQFPRTTWCQISICQYFTAAGAVWWFHRQLRCCQAQVPVLWWKGHHVIVWNKQVRCSIYLYCMSVNVLVSLVAPAIVLWPTLSSASRWTWCWSSVAVPNCCLARYDSIQLSYQTRPLIAIKVKSGLLANCSFGSRKISSEKDQSFSSKVRLMLTKSNMGAFSNYVNIIMPFSDLPSSPWTAFTLKDKNGHYLDELPRS